MNSYKIRTKLYAVWELAVKAQGVHADLRIPFPFPVVVKGGSSLPEGQTLVGMFAYRLARGHWRVQTGVTAIGEEGSMTTATVIPLAAVVGWEQRRAEWVDVAWLAMRVHAGNMQVRGGVIDAEGEDVDAPPTPHGPKMNASAPGDTPPPLQGPPHKRPRRAGGT